MHTNNIAKFIESKQSDSVLKTKLKLAMDKLDEVLAELDSLSAELGRAKSENSRLHSENATLRTDNNSIDSLRLENDEMKANYNAKKNNFLRVSHEKNSLLRGLNIDRNLKSFQYDPHNQVHSEHRGNSSRSDDDLFSIKEIIKLIPSFNGNSTDLRVYINKCSELWTFVQSDADRKRFVTVLKNNLSGDAALVLLDEEDLNDWESIRSILNENFNADPNHSNHIAMLQSFVEMHVMKRSIDDTCTCIEL